MAEMMIKIMPEMAAEIAKPLSSIDRINIYGTSGEGGAGVDVHVAEKEDCDEPDHGTEKG